MNRIASGFLCSYTKRQVIYRLLKGNLALCSFSSKIPDKPVWRVIDPKVLPKVPNLDSEMISHLERLSLVEFNNIEGVERLKSAIEYANQLHVVDTEGINPMYSVLEDEELLLMEDTVEEGGNRQEILQNAVKTEEDYFVAPPGNIPLKQSKDKFEKGDT